MIESRDTTPQAELVPIGLRRAGGYAWRVLLLVGAAVLVLWVLSRLAVVVLPVIGAILLAALVDPVARRLRATHLPNWIASIVAVVGLIAVLVGVGLVVVPGVVGQFGDVNINVAKGIRTVENFVIHNLPVSQKQVQQVVARGFGGLQSQIGGLASQVLGAASFAIELVIQAFVSLFLLFFFVKDGPRFYRWLRAAVPESRRRDVEVLLPEIWETLQSYLHGVLIIGFLEAIFYGLALLLIGVPLVLPIALLTFFGAFFPLVGALVVGALAALIALVSGGIGAALLVVGAALIVHQVEGNILQPLIMGHQVELHPALTLVVVTAGAATAGIVGAFLAVPIAAVVRRILRYASPRLATASERAALPDPPEVTTPEPESPPPESRLVGGAVGPPAK